MQEIRQKARLFWVLGLLFAGVFLNLQFPHVHQAIAADMELELVRAVYRGDIGAIQKLLDEGVSTSVMSPGQKPLLGLAAELGHADAVRVIVEAGADLTQGNRNGTTALLVAAKEGHSDVVRVLLEAGSDMTVIDTWGFSALMYASAYGHLEIAKILVAAGANINTPNDFGITALVRAAEAEGSPKIVRFLLDSGADTDVPGTLPPLFWARNPQVIEMLIGAGANVNGTIGEDEETILMKHIIGGTTEGHLYLFGDSGEKPPESRNFSILGRIWRSAPGISAADDQN